MTVLYPRVALIGLGRIGLAFGRIAAAMGMRLIAHDPYFPAPDRLGGLDIASVATNKVIKISRPAVKDTQNKPNK